MMLRVDPTRMRMVVAASMAGSVLWALNSAFAETVEPTSTPATSQSKRLDIEVTPASLSVAGSVGHA